MKRVSSWLLVVLLASATGPLAAQTIWRCGPDGRSFQAVPCTGGDRLEIRAAPTAEAVAEARAVASRERLALQSLAAERQERERDAIARGLGPAGIKPLAKPPVRKVKPGKKSGKKGPLAPSVTPWATAQASAD
jgi:hypothetical protein